MKLMDDSFSRVWCFSRYPYEQTRGYFFDLEAAEAYHAQLQDPNLEHKELLPDRSDVYPECIEPKRWALRANAEYGDNFNDLHYLGGRLLLTSSLRFGLDAKWRYYEEQPQAGGFDSLHLGTTDVTFQLAQTDRIQFRIGLGSNWLSDSQATNFGFNFNYAIDYFPRKPWIVSAEFDAGTLGNTHLFNFRATTGVLWRGLDAYVGFDYLDIGRFCTGSLIGGVTIWF